MLEAELFSLLERTADAAFALADDGTIEYWNKAAEQLFDYPADRVRHRGCYQILRGVGPLGTPVCHAGSGVDDGGGRARTVAGFDMNVQTGHGSRIWVHVSTLVFDNPRTGRRLLIHLAHDVSAQKQTEAFVLQMKEFFQQFSLSGEKRLQPAPVTPLSEQERHVLRLLAEGKNSLEIAGSLAISLQTLRNHLHHINQKLRTHNRLEAVMNAIQRRLI